jgi:hypothetical protein
MGGLSAGALDRGVGMERVRVYNAYIAQVGGVNRVAGIEIYCLSEFSKDIGFKSALIVTFCTLFRCLRLRMYGRT